MDLEKCQVVAPSGRAIGFGIEPRRQAALIAGLDEIAATLRRDTEIRAFQANDRQARPWIYTTGAEA